MEFRQRCSDHHKLQQVRLPCCLSDLMIKESTDVLSHVQDDYLLGVGQITMTKNVFMTLLRRCHMYKIF